MNLFSTIIIIKEWRRADKEERGGYDNHNNNNTGFQKHANNMQTMLNARVN